MAGIAVFYLTYAKRPFVDIDVQSTEVRSETIVSDLLKLNDGPPVHVLICDIVNLGEPLHDIEFKANRGRQATLEQWVSHSETTLIYHLPKGAGAQICVRPYTPDLRLKFKMRARTETGRVRIAGHVINGSLRLEC